MKRFFKAAVCIAIAFVMVFSAACAGNNSGGGQSTDSTGEYEGVDYSSPEKVIASGGDSDYRIVVPTDGSACVNFAAQELSDFLCDSTGARIAIVTDDTVKYSRRSKFISLDKTDLYEQAQLGVDESSLKLDGFVIKTQGNLVFISGARDKGTLYGVYDFLEKFVGVRFFTDTHTKVPELEEFAVHDMNITEIPAINVRDYYTPKVDRDALYTTRLRMVSLYGVNYEEYGPGMYEDMYVYAHNTLSLCSYDLYKDYENFFYSGGNLGYDICMSYGLNADGTVDESVELSPFTVVLDTLKQLIRDNPEISYYSVCQMDIPYGCPCSLCASRATVAQGGRSGILLRFLNALSNELEEWMAAEYPDGREITLVTFAYSYTLQPPIKANGEWAVVPNDNVAIWLAMQHNLAYSLSDPRQPRQFTDLMTRWAEQAKTFFYWDYRVNFREYLLYMPGLTTLKEDIQYLVDKNTEYAFLQSASGSSADPPVWLSDIKAYIASKLMWEPDQDVAAMLEEYLDFVYGSSAPVVKNIIYLFEDNYERLRQDEEASKEFGIDHELSYSTTSSKWYPRAMLTKAIELLEEEIDRVNASDMSDAEKAARTDQLINVLLTPQRMLLMNYTSYYENDAAGQDLLAKEFIANCERIGFTGDIGGYGNTFASIKESYGL